LTSPPLGPVDLGKECVRALLYPFLFFSSPSSGRRKIKHSHRRFFLFLPRERESRSGERIVLRLCFFFLFPPRPVGKGHPFSFFVESSENIYMFILSSCCFFFFFFSPPPEHAQLVKVSEGFPPLRPPFPLFLSFLGAGL